MGALSLLHAGPMVQAVLFVLLLGSIGSWAVIIQKIIALWRFGRDIRVVEASAGSGIPMGDRVAPLLAELIAARDAEPTGTSPEAHMARLAAMRAVSLGIVRRYEAGLPYLATLAATAPFIGLFGTVWGIMRSFAAISESNDTSLTVVAPGIAEALFATAVGLAAAIPAVVAFNLFRASLRRASHRLGAAVMKLARPAAGRAA